MKKRVTVMEAAKLAGVSRFAISAWVRSKLLQTVAGDDGRTKLILVADLKRVRWAVCAWCGKKFRRVKLSKEYCKDECKASAANDRKAKTRLARSRKG